MCRYRQMDGYLQDVIGTERCFYILWFKNLRTKLNFYNTTIASFPSSICVEQFYRVFFDIVALCMWNVGKCSIWIITTYDINQLCCS